MKIYLTRHGETEYNKGKLMQGRSDIPLNEKGIEQAKEAALGVKNIKFDAVYASPLDRAVATASIIGNVPRESIICDERILEADFGPFEGKPYHTLGPKMTLFWMYPEIFKGPKSAESIESMVSRSRSFLEDLKSKDYENVLVVCHGGIIRALCGVLENRPKGIKWRPRPKNCEIREYDL